MAAEEQFAFVLVRTKAAGNIGAAARALANMGFSDLRLIAPDGGADRMASELAAHGREVLRGARIWPDLATALHDRTLSIGTTRRPGLYRSAAVPLRPAATGLGSIDAGERVAFVFGPEDHGLSNDDLRYCQRLVTIPTAPEHSSINLAQSVMLVAYELFMAAHSNDVSGMAVDAPSASRHLFAPAPVPEVEVMVERMEKALISIGFLAADNPQRIMFALRGILGRAGLSRRETDILNGIAHQIAWYAQGGRAIINQKLSNDKRIR
jgi:tRNA/rRNA methyltransferase